MKARRNTKEKSKSKEPFSSDSTPTPPQVMIPGEKPPTHDRDSPDNYELKR